MNANLEKNIKSLPQELQDAITSPEFGEKVDKIGEKYELHIDQLGELVNEVGLVLLGENKVGDFVGHIKNSLEISEEKASEIAKDVSNDIFLPIREALYSLEKKEPVPEITLETPEEILKHIEDGGLELPAPETPVPSIVPEQTKPVPPAPIPEKKSSYTVDPYREPLS